MYCLLFFTSTIKNIYLCYFVNVWEWKYCTFSRTFFATVVHLYIIYKSSLMTASVRARKIYSKKRLLPTGIHFVPVTMAARVRNFRRSNVYVRAWTYIYSRTRYSIHPCTYKYTHMQYVHISGISTAILCAKLLLYCTQNGVHGCTQAVINFNWHGLHSRDGGITRSEKHLPVPSTGALSRPVRQLLP